MNSPLQNSDAVLGAQEASQFATDMSAYTIGQSEPAAVAAQTPDNAIMLDEPIRRGNTDIGQVVLRKPSSGELRGVRLDDLLSGDVNALLLVLPRISMPTLVKHEVDGLDPADLAKFGEVIIGFFLPKAQREKLASRS